jgi:hypothetical protein
MLPTPVLTASHFTAANPCTVCQALYCCQSLYFLPATILLPIPVLFANPSALLPSAVFYCLPTTTHLQAPEMSVNHYTAANPCTACQPLNCCQPTSVLSASHSASPCNVCQPLHCCLSLYCLPLTAAIQLLYCLLATLPAPVMSVNHYTAAYPLHVLLAINCCHPTSVLSASHSASPCTVMSVNHYTAAYPCTACR